MAASTIAPTTPVVTQGHPIGETTDSSPGIEQVQSVFDKVYPDRKSQAPTPETQPKTADAPPAPVTPPAEPQESPPQVEPKPTDIPAEERHLPTFLQEALKEPAVKQEPRAPEAEEWPEELPAFKTPEESKERYRAWRKQYNTLKGELQQSRNQPQGSQEQRGQLEYLQRENKQMAETLTRLGVQHSAEFQRNILQPLYGAWNEASRIVRDSGADPNQLAKAMSLQGRAQFEALDELFSDMPESAKAEANDALRQYRRFEDARKNALANAPKTFESIQRKETERQYQEINKTRENMKTTFDQALRTLRDEAKVEVFVPSHNPDDKWWNEQGQHLVDQARDLYMENTDMARVAYACLLAPAADAYRKLFLSTHKENQKLRKIIDQKIGGEPYLGESSGNAASLTPDSQMKEDLKQPFDKVFLREFHKLQAKGR
jgi:hypothetical protein